MAKVVTIFPGRVTLLAAGDDTGGEQLGHPVGEQLGVHPEVAVVAQGADGGGGDRADADLDGGAVGDALGDDARRSRGPSPPPWPPASRAAGSRPRPSPTTWETCTWFSPRVRGMLGLASRKNGRLPDQAGHVVGVGAEREPAVAVGRRRRGDHDRHRRHVVEDVRHLGEVGGGEVDAALGEAGPGDVREEVRDVAQARVRRRGGRAGRATSASGAPARPRGSGPAASSAAMSVSGSPLASGHHDVVVDLRVLDDGRRVAAVRASECVAHGCLLGSVRPWSRR